MAFTPDLKRFIEISDIDIERGFFSTFFPKESRPECEFWNYFEELKDRKLLVG